MKTSLETENNFKLSKIELLPMNDISNSYGNLLEKYKFTGHERDQNTNYDYMHARFYVSSMGRFLKPDNVTGSPMNPQNWNLYSYVRGNPVNFNDPTGYQGEEPNSKLPQSGGDPNATKQGKEQVKEEQSENKDKEPNKPPQGAGGQNSQNQDIEKATLTAPDPCDPQLKPGEQIPISSDNIVVKQIVINSPIPQEEKQDVPQAQYSGWEATLELVKGLISTTWGGGQYVTSTYYAVYYNKKCDRQVYQIAAESSLTSSTPHYMLNWKPIPAIEVDPYPLGEAKYVGPYKGD